MDKITYTIKDKTGIHARPAGMLVKLASSYKSNITISTGDKSADAKKIFAVMGLNAKCGQTITVTADGEDEGEAIEKIGSFLNNNL